MTPQHQQILQFLDYVTDPRNVGKLTRTDYATAQAAIDHIGNIFTAFDSRPAAGPTPPLTPAAPAAEPPT